MATTTRETFEARWRAAVTEPKHFQDPDGSRSTGLDNSEAFYEWEQTVAEIATRLVDDGLDDEELHAVERIAGDIWDEVLQDRLIAWAEAYEARWEAKRQAMADHVAPYLTPQPA